MHDSVALSRRFLSFSAVTCVIVAVTAGVIAGAGVEIAAKAGIEAGIGAIVDVAPSS